ncbi:MAG TPA: L,D-transpeptidase [Solirubrobacteraceae bacterium]|nr:L,D-transpeptidase [Solirubrobacteraceae bacterium]
MPPGETLGARLVRATELRSAPDGAVLSHMSTRTSFGSRRVLAVVSAPGPWLEVLSSTLPNGRSGWIRATDVTLLRETWSIDVDLSRRSMTLRHFDRPYRRMAVAVGATGTPTPPGRYAVTDRLRTGSPSSPYGCCVLALTGRQPNVPQDWDGGDRLAIHGTSDPASIGSAASLGCIRASADDMRLLMARVPLGTPVRIRA